MAILKRRMVDIGDRVRAGQPLAEIDAPELDEQIRQAKANLAAGAARRWTRRRPTTSRARPIAELARVTAERWSVPGREGRCFAAGKRSVPGRNISS